MNYFILLEGMLVGLFFFSGLFSLFLAIVNVEKKINLSFFIFAVFLGLGVLFNIIYLHTPSIEKYILHLKISAGFLAAAGISFVFLIAHITDYKPKVLKYAIVVGMTAVIVLNVISEYAFTWSHISEIKSTKLLWGDTIYQPVGEVSPALYFSVINIVLLFVFAFLSTRQLIKSGDKIRGYFLIGTIGAGVLGILCNQLFLILWDIKLIVIDEIGYTGFIVLIAYINFKSVLQSYHIEQELKLNEVKFRTLVTGMNEAVIQVDNNDRVVFVNEKFTEIMGYTLDELKGKICNEIIAGESERDVIIDINKRRLKGLKNQYEISFYSKSGEKIDFLVSGTPVYDSDGKVMGSFGVMTDITSRKRAEEAIKLNEEKFRSFIEQSTNGFVLANHNGEIIEFNDAQEKLTGIKKEDAVGKYLWEYQYELTTSDVVNYDLVKERFEVIKKAAGDSKELEKYIEKIEPTELHIQSKNGLYLVVLQTIFPIKTEHDFYIGSMYVDITERKASEETIKRERHNFMKVFEEAPIAMQIIEKDYPNKRIAVNQAYAELFDLSKAELLDAPLRNQFEAEALSEETYQEINEVFQEYGELENYPVEFNTQITGQKKILFTVKPIVFNDRLYNLNVLQDVTEIEEAKKELQFAFDYIQFIVDSIQSVIIAVDKELNVTHYNKVSEKFSNGSKSESYLFNKFPKLRFIKETLLQSISGEEDMDNISKSIVHKNGETQHFQLSISKVNNDERPGYVIMVEDITDRKKIDELMIQSEKMLSVAGLAAGMAHEINNPLGTIVQGCQNIIRRTSDKLPKNNDVAEKVGTTIHMVEAYLKDRQVYEIINSMRSAANKASDIIKNMLQFSRRSESKKVLYNIITLVNDALELAYNDYDMKKKLDFRSIEVKKEFPVSIPDVKLTVTEIEQVIFNILRNAAQALNDDKHKINYPQIIFRIYQEPKYVVLEIEDNGPGIPEDVKNRIFEPFYTTKEIGEGSGLGLSVSYMIIKNNHSGILAVQSEEGKGANFIIKLPL